MPRKNINKRAIVNEKIQQQQGTPLGNYNSGQPKINKIWKESFQELLSMSVKPEEKKEENMITNQEQMENHSYLEDPRISIVAP